MINFGAIHENETHVYSYKITEKVYQNFLSAFEDNNPLHVSEEYAKDKGFQGRVMHGNILNGFVSHFIGMRFPAENVILQSLSLAYKSPTFLNDEIQIEARVDQKIDALNILVLKLIILNKGTSKKIATGKAQVGFLE